MQTVCKRIIPMLLAVLLAFGAFGVVGTAKGNTSWILGSVWGTVTYGLDIYKVSGETLTKLSDGDNLKQGDVVEVQLCFGTDFYLGFLSTEIYYDSTVFEPYLNGAAYTNAPSDTFNESPGYIQRLTDGAPTAQTVNGDTVTLFDTMESIAYNGYNGYVNKDNNESFRKQWTPLAWRVPDANGIKKSTYAIDAAYQNLHIIGLVLNCSPNSSTQGYEIKVPYAPYFSFQLRVKANAPDGTSTSIFLPMAGVRTGFSPEVMCNRLYAYQNPDGIYSVVSGDYSFATGYDLTNADVDFSIGGAHNYGEPAWEWAADYSAATALFHCTECDYTLTVNATQIDCSVVEPATCMADAVVYYTATAVLNGDEYFGFTDLVTLEGSATGHSFTNYVSNNDAYCMCDGTKTAWCDYGCGTYITIPDPGTAPGHTPDSARSENYVNPTCTAAGSHDEVVYCSWCGEELSRETVTDPAYGHNPGALQCENYVDPNCTDNGSHDEVVYCSWCGEELSRETVTDPAYGHSFGYWYLTKEPTYTTEGEEARTCSSCGAVETRSIPMLDPTYAPTFALSGATAVAGQQVSLTLSISNNPGIVATSIGVTYDPDVLRLVSVEGSDLLGEGNFYPGKDLTLIPYTLLWEDSLTAYDYTGNGAIATLTFEVLADAPIGETPITLSYVPNSTVNAAIEEVDFALTNGIVNVIARLPGDANDDGVVDLKDVIILRRYLAGGWDVTINPFNADVNADNLVDAKDVVLLRRALSGGWGVTLL